MEREKLKSRLGFILLSAGCAIGIGNVWKFPYMAGQGGGGAFVLFYLLFLVILGLPIMTMEFSVGRASHKSPVRAYQALEKPGQKWHIHGYFTLIGCYLLMMFYTTVAGWMLHYFYMTAAGKLVGLDADQVAGKFTEMLASPLTMGFWMVVVVAIGIFVCARGLQNGLEKVTKVMMIALLVIMVVLAVNSMFMPGAKEGLTFFLVPDFERMKEVGIVNTLVGAMNQAFFTLSLGIGAMAIFGSYIGKEHALLGESVRVWCWIPSSPSPPASSSSRPASLTVWTRPAAPASSSSPCPTSSQIWRWAVCGAACSSCLWPLRHFPPCWPSSRTSSAAAWS